MSGFRVEKLEVPKVFMDKLSLRYLSIRLGLTCVDQVGEFDGVLYKEYRDIIA